MWSCDDQGEGAQIHGWHTVRCNDGITRPVYIMEGNLGDDGSIPVFCVHLFIVSLPIRPQTPKRPQHSMIVSCRTPWVQRASERAARNEAMISPALLPFFFLRFPPPFSLPLVPLGLLSENTLKD